MEVADFSNIHDPDRRRSAEMGYRIEQAKAAIVKAAQPGTIHACQCCGQPMPAQPVGWLNPRTLREQANAPVVGIGGQNGRPHQATILSIAMHNLIEEGVFEINTRLQVRLAEIDIGTPSERCT